VSYYIQIENCTVIVILSKNCLLSQNIKDQQTVTKKLSAAESEISTPLIPKPTIKHDLEIVSSISNPYNLAPYDKSQYYPPVRFLVFQ
jgi:hypothetical protein